MCVLNHLYWLLETYPLFIVPSAVNRDTPLLLIVRFPNYFLTPHIIPGYLAPRDGAYKGLVSRCQVAGSPTPVASTYPVGKTSLGLPRKRISSSADFGVGNSGLRLPNPPTPGLLCCSSDLLILVAQRPGYLYPHSDPSSDP
jgi:hypothetical protein